MGSRTMAADDLRAPTGYFWTQDSLPPSDTVGFPGTPYPGRHRRGYSRPGESAPMPQLRLRLQGGKFSYVKVVAERDGVVPDQLATLVAHRLEWRPFPFLILGGSEMASIGGRVPGPIYWLPLVPLKFLEHQVRDKDNLALSVDVEVRQAGWGRAYGELYLDDFSGPPFSFWGNKFAYTLGFEWLDPFRLPATWRAEFAHVDPWVFTHHLPGRQHQHAGALYGSALPANAHALWTQVAVPLPRDLEASLEYVFQQRDLRSRGSSPFDVHLKGVDSDEKDFLGTVPETRHRLDMDPGLGMAALCALQGRRGPPAGRRLEGQGRGKPGQPRPSRENSLCTIELNSVGRRKWKAPRAAGNLLKAAGPGAEVLSQGGFEPTTHALKGRCSTN